jgi:DNA-directed RNA polymerase subunit K/omega
MAEEEKLTKYERARIIGSRALQLSQGAPILVKLDEKKLQEIGYDAVKIAKLELEAGLIPITVKRPLPKTAAGSASRAAVASHSEKKE